ncbi:MAG: hypothetical protein OEM03_09745 [Chromatiales bacterium]|nr:hypothetical protein [Chromatiales bacterium]
MIELLAPITMFLVLIGGAQRALDYVGSWELDFLPAIYQQFTTTPDQRLCIGITQSRIVLPRSEGERGLAFVIEGDVSDRLSGEFGETVSYRIVLGPGISRFELCSIGSSNEQHVTAEGPGIQLRSL